MRRLILLVVLAVTVLPAGAAKPTTVEQLERTLAADTAAHRADADIALQIGTMKLSERLTDATLARFAAKLTPGPKTVLALRLLADESLFLDPPAAELPATPAPDSATQQRILEKTRAYVVQTLPHLPDFFATRTTFRFDDSPQTLVENGWPVRAGLHLSGTSSREITFRDDQEVPDPDPKTLKAKAGAVKTPQELGIRTLGGEFGPMLALVLIDSEKGSLNFNHWEQGSKGVIAVYRYSVPRAASHYVLNYCCERPQTAGGRGGGRGRRGGGGAGAQALSQPDAKAQPYITTPGYHGSLFIDPVTGVILRITLQPDLPERGLLARADNIVDYGPVEIGGRNYIRPVRSLGFTMEQAAQSPRPGQWPILMVNETSFTNYHRLGTTTRILTDAPEPAAPNPANPPTPQPASPQPGTQAAPTSTPAPAPPEDKPAPKPPAAPSARPAKP
jgi:cell division septation protein DedD